MDFPNSTHIDSDIPILSPSSTSVSSSLISFALILLLSTISLTSVFYLKFIDNHHDLPKGVPQYTTGIPWFGDLIEYTKGPSSYLKSAREKYGDRFYTNMFVMKGTWLLGPEMIKFFLESKEKVLSSRSAALLTLGRITTPSYLKESKFWLSSLKSVYRSPMFTTLFPQIITSQTQTTLSQWSTQPNIDLFPSVSVLAQQIITRCFLGEDFFAHDFDELWPIFINIDNDLGSKWDFLFPIWFPHPGALRQWWAKRRFMKIFERRLRIRKEVGWKNEEERDYTSFAMNREETKRFRELIPTHIFLFTWAAHISTVPTIAWTITELLNSPTFLSDLRSELDKTFPQTTAPNPDGQNIFYDPTSRIPPSLHAAIRETLRLYSPINLIRRSTHPVTLPGTSTTIPENTLVFISPYLAHTDPTTYPNPYQWLPERFLDDGEAVIRKLNANGAMNYLPFGGGPHRCPGEKMAMAVVVTVLGMLLRDYDISWPDNGIDDEVERERRKVEREERMRKLDFRPIGSVWTTSPVYISVSRREKGEGEPA